ncbi:hypothetical protein FHS36_004630 [Streptomyces eurocidicus]|uniref:Uncharacterized protein n=1 Tax=Streptomyces eurocidicus TaxID=66423 RepID=A0A7W8BE76_STREU|nr:hypothetical protein [Streptomyces eurocidicus]
MIEGMDEEEVASRNPPSFRASPSFTWVTRGASE